MFVRKLKQPVKDLVVADMLTQHLTLAPHMV